MISGRPRVPQEIRPQGAAVRRYEPGTAEDWIDGLEPPPLIDGVFMLDGYLTAIIVGPCSIDPSEWLRHHTAGSAWRVLSSLPRSWRSLRVSMRQRGVGHGIRLRYADWQPLRDLSRIEHGLLLPTLLHCTGTDGHLMLGPVRPGSEGEEFLRAAYHDIPAVVPAIREYWMPQRAQAWSG